jgi:hypothetical protein
LLGYKPIAAFFENIAPYSVLTVNGHNTSNRGIGEAASSIAWVSQSPGKLDR